MFVHMLEMSESSTNLGRRQSKWEFHIPVSTLFVMLTVCFTCRTVFSTNRKSINMMGSFNVSPHMCSRKGGWWMCLCTTSDQLAMWAALIKANWRVTGDKARCHTSCPQNLLLCLWHWRIREAGHYQSTNLAVFRIAQKGGGSSNPCSKNIVDIKFA